MSGTLSSHVLDASSGAPATGVSVTWQRYADGAWATVADATTDPDGRVTAWPTGDRLVPGRNRLVFGSGDYFAGRGLETFYPEVVVVFEVRDESTHHHVPLLLSPFAYSTYRGS